MIRWIKRACAAALWRYVERHMQSLFESGDYNNALRHAIRLCQQREDNVTAQHWRALAFVSMGDYEQALDVANWIKEKSAEGVIQLSEPWAIAFDEVKCCALWGLSEYDALYQYSALCLDRHAGVVSLTSYHLLATMQLGLFTESTPSFRFLDSSINSFNQAWQFVTLYSAQMYLGNVERAREVAAIALTKYPDDSGVRKLADARCVAPDSVSPCLRRYDSKHVNSM